jgi:hypothetical protein
VDLGQGRFASGASRRSPSFDGRRIPKNNHLLRKFYTGKKIMKKIHKFNANFSTAKIKKYPLHLYFIDI